MSELIIPNEKVRELTSAPRHIPIEVEGAITFEMFLTIWSSYNPKETNTANDLGPEWHESIRSATSDELEDELKALGGPYMFSWLAVSALLTTAPHPHDPDNALKWLRSIENKRLRRWILGYCSANDDRTLIEKAASGDAEAGIELLGEKAQKKPGMADFLTWLVDADDLPARYADAAERFRAEGFAAIEEEFAGAIERAAAARRAVPPKGDTKAIIEDVTSGLDIEIPLGLNRVVLIPSLVTRPLSLLDWHRGSLIAYYGMADEFINSDPEAPPSWLVRTYKALSDERRLRILRRLSEGETTLDQLTEMLGLSKSTVHHHMSLLRGAGLVRIQLPSEESQKNQHTYTLRESALNDASAFLDTYLKTTHKEEKHA